MKDLKGENKMQTIDEMMNGNKEKVIVKENKTGYVFASLLIFVGLVILAMSISGLKQNRESEPLRQSVMPSELSVKGMNVTNPVSIENNNTNFYTVVNNNTNFYTVVNNISITNMPYVPPLPSDEVKLIKEEREKSSAMAALFAINHVNWVVTKIKNYNDPMVLEEEYKNISADSLNLNTIKDQEVIELICDIMDVITDMRIEEKEREFLKEELDQGMSDAIYDAFSGISAGGGLSPAAAVFNILSSAATSAMNYKRAKRQLLAAYKKKTWGLDKNRMLYLNELNKSLLQKYWVIVQRYNLPDEYRVSEQDIALLIDHLKDENPQRQHDFLVSMEGKYKGLQNYWYYRGLAAYQCTVTNDVAGTRKLRLIADEKESRMRDARYSLGLYQKARKDYGSMLRVDGIAAKAAMLQIRLMVADDEDCKKSNKSVVWADQKHREQLKEKYREQLAIIENNSTIEEWQAFYFCALIYVNQLKDIVTADKVLAPIIAHLDYKRNRRLVDWQEVVLDKKASKSTNAVDRLVSSGDALFECRKLLATGATNSLGKAAFESRLAKICDDENASAREKIFCYGDLSYKKALEKMLPDLRKMRVVRKGKNLKISLPMSWVVSREGVSRLGVSDRHDFMNNVGGKDGNYNKENEKQERSIEERDDGLYALVDFGDFEDIDSASNVIYTMRYDRADKTGRCIKGSYLVVVAFDINGSKEFKPSKACFGPWVVGKGRQKSTWETKPGTNKPDFEIQSL